MKARSAMQPLNFRNDSKLFDGHCVRLDAISGKKVVHCGITLAALKQIDSHLPHEGLLPSELFVEAFDRNAELGSTVAIVGSGPIGLAALLTGSSIRRPRLSWSISTRIDWIRPTS